VLALASPSIQIAYRGGDRDQRDAEQKTYKEPEHDRALVGGHKWACAVASGAELPIVDHRRGTADRNRRNTSFTAEKSSRWWRASSTSRFDMAGILA
jgi:hypothetical protein